MIKSCNKWPRIIIIIQHFPRFNAVIYESNVKWPRIPHKKRSEFLAFKNNTTLRRWKQQKLGFKESRKFAVLDFHASKTISDGGVLLELRLFGTEGVAGKWIGVHHRRRHHGCVHSAAAEQSRKEVEKPWWWPAISPCKFRRLIGINVFLTSEI